MAIIKIKTSGGLVRTKSYLTNRKRIVTDNYFDDLGKMGVEELRKATPVDSGLTSESWYYEITKNHDNVTISFRNSNVVNGVPIAIILQYGHGTGTGGYVVGRDYINPATQIIFDKMASDLWKGATR